MTAALVKRRQKTPLYWRLLRLRHVHPSSWQRATFFEGSLVVAAVLVLADVASAWLLLALPLTVAALVKGHDVLVGLLTAAPSKEPQPLVEPAPRLVEPPADLDDDEPSVRVIPAPQVAARARPGAVAARARASAGGRDRLSRAEPAPGDAAKRTR